MGWFKDRRGKGKLVNLNDTYETKSGGTASWSDAGKPWKVEGTNFERIQEHKDLMDRVNKALNPKPKKDDPWTF